MTTRGILLSKGITQLWKVSIPAAGPWDTTSGPRPGRMANRGGRPVPLTMYTLLITYFPGHQQHGKIITTLQNF
jgi:hypothetical protein